MDEKLHFCFDIPNGRALFKELVLHVACGLEHDRLFGAVKLNKILWMADFAAFASTGQPITGTEYRKLPLGPVPIILPEVRDEMIQDKDAGIRKENVGMPFPQDRLVPLRSPDYSIGFRSIDIGIVDGIINQYRYLTGRELTDLSHGVSWEVAELNAPIPYEAAFLSDEPYTFEDVVLTSEMAERYGWE